METAQLKRVLELNGLSSYQAELYVTLLTVQESSVGDLARSSSVPQPRTYDVIDELDDRGYVETYEQENLRARVAQPESLVQELRSKATDLVDAADEIENRWEQPELRSSEINVFNRIDTMFGNSKEEIRTAKNKLHISLPPAKLLAISDALREASEQDVLVQISVHQSRKGSVPFEDVEPLLRATATEVRRVQSLAPQLILVDGGVAFLAAREGFTNEYGIQVSDHMLTSMLHWYFQIQVWETSEVVYSDDTGSGNRYINIREFIRDVESFLQAGDRVHVSVNGYSTQTGEAVSKEGDVVDTIYADDAVDSTAPLSNPYIHASFMLETDGAVFSVGGYGAIKEDIRATLIEIESV